MAGLIGYLFHMDPLRHLASDLLDQVVRAAAAQHVLGEIERARRPK